MIRKLEKLKNLIPLLESENYEIGRSDALKTTGKYELAARQKRREKIESILDSLIAEQEKQ